MRRFIALVLAALFVPPLTSLAQIQIGTVNGVVLDAAGAVLPGARVSLKNPLTGLQQGGSSDASGAFAFNNVPFAEYSLRVEATGFLPASRAVAVRSNLPVKMEIRLGIAGAAESVTVRGDDGIIDEKSSGTQHNLADRFIARFPTTNRNRQLQSVLATLPGWTTENDGLLHIRGVDDGILYVIDGIPTTDRLDATFAASPDAELIHAVEVITGNIPAEFGGRSGAVVMVQPKSGIDAGWGSSISLGASSFNTKEIVTSFGGSLGRRLGLFVSASGYRSTRFLDPVNERNLNNRGGAVKLNVRSDWHPTTKDILLFTLSGNGTDFHVTNTGEQELAGQRQRQELRDNSQSASWQRVWSSQTVTNVAGFRRFYESRLLGSEFDTPVTATQDRKHTRAGLIASLTHARRGHTLKIGVETSRVTPDEFFRFAVTDAEEAEEADISDAALAFDLDNPFIFRNRTPGSQVSAYVQDSFSPVKNLTVNAGARFDHFRLKVSDSQVSPRLGAAYYLPHTRTAIRASFNRLFMPPQIENLLLADSEQARVFSPFVPESGGGALIRSERSSAYEVGFAQNVLGLFKFDAAYWRRDFRNVSDPNVFFGTTILFPNSVARGFARGVDARVDVPRRLGWSGYASYTNQRVLQQGPINGGLFLTDEVIEIGPGVRFIPDHDQRNVAAFGVTYEYRRIWTFFTGRHESGVPLEIEGEELEELREEAGADLIDFERARVKPYTVFNFAVGVELFKDERATAGLQFVVQNMFNRRFAYNFGNPFSGTHFGHPRLIGGRLRLTFH